MIYDPKKKYILEVVKVKFKRTHFKHARPTNVLVGVLTLPLVNKLSLIEVLHLVANFTSSDILGLKHSRLPTVNHD